ncbi:MAG: DUF4124 domain-containing protein [Zoogloea sp.]|nr:DUF4124 domain-containing protein [Zoogloea sp.]
MRGIRDLRCVLAAVFLLAPVGQAWAVNKCVGADGRVTYTDGSCGDGSQGARVNTLPPPSVRDQIEARRRAEQMVQDVNRIETRQAYEAAERRRRVEMEQAAEAEQQRRAQREAQRQAAQEESQRLLVIRPAPLVPYHPHPAPQPPKPTKPVDETRSAQMRGYPPIR